MTLIQLKVVILTAELGSVSLAAKELGISQSNASSYLKNIEDELGVKLLERSRAGVKVTEYGRNFIEYARNILNENEKIKSLAKYKSIYRLRVGSMNYSKAAEAFVKICHEQIDNKAIDLKYQELSLETGIDLLRDYKLDIVVGFVRNMTISSGDWITNNYNIKRIHLTDIPFYVRIRKDHPLTKDDTFLKGPITMQMFKDYPYIDYCNFNTNTKSPVTEDGSYKDFSSQILTDGKETRYAIIGNTNGYCIGVDISEEYKNKYGLVTYPIEGLIGDLNIFVRKGEEEKEEIKHYIELLKELLNI